MSTNGRLEANETLTQKGRLNVYPNPSDRASGTLDAPWGEAPPPPVTHGTAVEREAQNVRGDMIDRLFDSPGTSAPAEQNAMDQYFAHAKDGNPHSPLLQRGRTKIAADETLGEQVERVVGLR